MTNATVTTTMSTRGRVVIPKAVRDRAGFKAGDVVTLQLVDDAIQVRRASLQAPSDGPHQPEDATPADRDA